MILAAHLLAILLDSLAMQLRRSLDVVLLGQVIEPPNFARTLGPAAAGLHLISEARDVLLACRSLWRAIHYLDLLTAQLNLGEFCCLLIVCGASVDAAEQHRQAGATSTAHATYAFSTLKQAAWKCL